jgi:hypothetical protein
MISDDRVHPRLPVSQALLRAAVLLPVLTASLVLTGCHLDRLVSLPASSIDRFTFPIKTQRKSGALLHGPVSSVSWAMVPVSGGMQRWSTAVPG